MMFYFGNGISFCEVQQVMLDDDGCLHITKIVSHMHSTLLILSVKLTQD